MRSKLFLSLIGVCVSLGSTVLGCGDDVTVQQPPKANKSQLGESCARTDDCDADLVCIANYCAEGAGSGEGGAGTVGPPGPVLSGEGESCTLSADCEKGFVCIENTCLEPGSSGEPPPRLGERGESCESPDDCA